MTIQNPTYGLGQLPRIGYERATLEKYAGYDFEQLIVKYSMRQRFPISSVLYAGGLAPRFPWT